MWAIQEEKRDDCLHSAANVKLKKVLEYLNRDVDSSLLDTSDVINPGILACVFLFKMASKKLVGYDSGEEDSDSTENNLHRRGQPEV